MKLNLKAMGAFGTGLVAMAILIAAPGFLEPVQAHKGASGVVKQRMDTMKEMKGQLKQISEMLEGKKAYSDKKIRKSLDYIRSNAGISMSKMFPRGTAHKPSEADPMIWKNWEEFKKLAVILNHSTDDFRAKLPEKVDNNTLKNLQKEHLKIRKVCKSCHDKFRL